MKMHFTITESERKPESEAHHRRNNVSRSEWRKAHPASTRYNNIPTRFVGVDGEGVTLADGTHSYVLLGIADQQITNPNGLTFLECVEFLWDNFEQGSVAYVGFFLGYDFVQMFRSLPEERARMLLSKEGKAKRAPRKTSNRVQPFPVEYKGYEFDILGTKRLKIRKQGSKRWMHICDTGPFFQKSFLKVIDPKEWSDPVVSQEEYDQIAVGKARRSSAVLDRDMLHYNARENEILARVMCALNEGFQSLGIYLKPSQWFGPGQAAQAWLDGRAVTAERLQEVTPEKVLESARMSYFGGWFEIMAHGLIPGITWEYDINSAYPYIISGLPCLEHGEWRHNDTANQFTLVYAKVHGSNPYIGSMLHRDNKGNISRPHHTEGWYWLHEIEAAIAAGMVSDFETVESWSYVPCNCPPPLREVRKIYALRKEVGKKTPLGIACKLVPNSLYGKFAQSIGNPKYANPVYASLITAGCRTMILNAIATHPKGAEDVLMVATDGVYFRTPHPTIPQSGDLGDWDNGEKKNLCLFKPGVYWDNDTRASIKAGNSAVFKSRGINAADFGKQLAKIDRLFAYIKAMRYLDKWPHVEFPVSFSMVTAVQALQRNNWELAGTLNPDPMGKQTSNPKGKRQDPYWWLPKGKRSSDHMILRSHPKENLPYVPSVPYEKRFGMEDPWSQEARENHGITADGLPNDMVAEVLYGR